MPNTKELMKDQQRLIPITPPGDEIMPTHHSYMNLETDISSNGIINNHNDIINKNNAMNDDDSVFYVNVAPKNVKPAAVAPGPRTRSRVNSGKRGQQFDQYDDDDDTSNYYELPAGLIGDGDVNNDKYVNVNPQNTRSPKKIKSSYINLFFPSPLVRTSSSTSPLKSSSSHSSDSTQSPTSSLVHSSSTSSFVSRTSSSPATSCDYVRINPNKTAAIQRSISEHRHREKKKKNKKGL